MQQSQIIGPTEVTPDLFDAAVALSNSVFRKNRGRDGDMQREFPSVFRKDNLETLRVMLHEGRPVSLVGMPTNDVQLLGCDLRLVCIGSVCTDEAYRGQGLAGTLMDDAIRRARDNGAALMLISGGRSLYTTRGAHSGGIFVEYELSAPLPGSNDDLQCQAIGEEDHAPALRLFNDEATRFRRSEAEYRRLIGCGMVINRSGGTWVVRRGGRMVAVFSAALPREDQDHPTLAIREQAGDRSAVLHGALQLAGEVGAQMLQLRAYPWDENTRGAWLQAGADIRETTSLYTVRILDARRLLEAMMPLLIERAGEAISTVEVIPEEDDRKLHTLRFRLDGEEVCLEGSETIIHTVFGHPESQPTPEPDEGLGGLLRRALPLPLPMYGLNYV